MDDDICLQEITDDYDELSIAHVPSNLHKACIKRILHRVIQPNFFKQSNFNTKLPILKKNVLHDRGIFSIYLLGIFQRHTLELLIEIMSNWLLPGRILSYPMVFAGKFSIPSHGSIVYTACEIQVDAENEVDLDQLIKNFDLLESEIALCINSPFYVNKLQRIKGFSFNAKIALVRDNVNFLLEKRPKFFDLDTLGEMQHMLLICSDEFKLLRNSRHLTRIIGIQYLFRKFFLAKKTPNKRNFFLKIFRTELQSLKKNALCFIVSFNFLTEKENFEKEHLMRSIQSLISDVKIIENSFVNSQRPSERFCSIYLEIEKINGEKFSSEEITKLRHALPLNLSEGVEQLVHSVFMPRNEEEIMRNILSLSSEVKFVRDLPQVMITYDEQKDTKLVFTVILVRVLKPGDNSILELFNKHSTILEFSHDRCKTIGYLRNKYTKEANVLIVKIEKDDFLRRDHSIDLNKARQAIAFELLKILGEYRDYNGGMITKQNELLSQLKALMIGSAAYNELLFENFFFAIKPIVMRTVLDLEELKFFYMTFHETLRMMPEANKNYLVYEGFNASCMVVIVKAELPLNLDELEKSFAVMQIKPLETAVTSLQLQDMYYYCYSYRSSDTSRQEQFGGIIRQVCTRVYG